MCQPVYSGPGLCLKCVGGLSGVCFSWLMLMAGWLQLQLQLLRLLLVAAAGAPAAGACCLLLVVVVVLLLGAASGC